jgi:hypothetical protein
MQTLFVYRLVIESHYGFGRRNECIERRSVGETYNHPKDRTRASAIFCRRTSWRRHMTRTGRAAIMRSVAAFRVPRAYSALEDGQYTSVERRRRRQVTSPC